ncbi:MAG: phosphoglycolate phosphatase [Rhodoferax sp.]|nr:phosphoglycolate phosphatase [Rhodoferax sp.]
MMPRMLRTPAAILFDLDGTLLDTAGDIALALSRAFADHGHTAPAPAAVRQMIGKGGPVLVERAVAAQGLHLDAAGQAALLERFFHHYGGLQERDECAAEPYPGAREALARLHAAGWPLAVVTNKYHRFATGLLQRLDLARYLRVVVGGDTCERRKPDPMPLHHACAQLGVASADALMVGDSANDVEAARAAGMPVVLVPYGYTEGQDPRLWPCDQMVESLDELPGLLTR